MRTRDLEIIRVYGASIATNNTRLAADLDPFPYLILHFHLIFICQYHDARIGLILVRDHQLIQHRIYLRRPSEYECVVILEHLWTPFAEAIHLRFEPVAQYTDQCADNENAAKSYEQHHGAEAWAGITTHRTRVECAHQAFPRSFTEGQGSTAILCKVGQCDDGPSDKYNDQRKHEQHAYHCRRAA